MNPWLVEGSSVQDEGTCGIIKTVSPRGQIFISDVQKPATNLSIFGAILAALALIKAKVKIYYKIVCLKSCLVLRVRMKILTARLRS